MEALTVAIYARVSTPDQTPDSQLVSLREYAARRGFAVYREYVDMVTGAVTPKRAARAFQELMADAHALRFNCVLVWKFDRFARSLRHLLQALETFETLNIDFISATQAMDTTTPMGRMLFAIVGAFAEMERELILERSRAGMEAAKRRGVAIGRPRDIALRAAVRKLEGQGLSIREIARRAKCSPAGAMKILKGK